MRYVAQLVRATHDHEHVRYGAGVRAAQTLVLAAKVGALMAGRVHVSFDDIRAAAKPALRHRLVLNFEGEAEGVATDTIVDAVLDQVPRVPEEAARLG